MCQGRNDDFLDNAIEYAQSVVISAELLRLVPSWLKPYDPQPDLVQYALMGFPTASLHALRPFERFKDRREN